MSAAAGVVALPRLTPPALNACVRARLAEMPLRDPDDAGGRLLYLQRLGALVLPHCRDGGGWVCTLAGGTLDARTAVGGFLVEDVEIAAALELRDPAHPTVDMTLPELCATWMLRVWSRWPGGRMVQVASALLERLDPVTLTMPAGPPWQAAVALRAGMSHARGLAGPVARLGDAGLLGPYEPEPGWSLLTLPVERFGS